MLTRQQKTVKMEALREKVARAQAIIAVDYRGLTVDETNELRSNFRKAADGAAIDYQVAKNTLLKRAASESPFEPMFQYLTGPTAVAIAYEEPSVMAKVLVDFAKDNEKLELKGGAMDGEAIDVAAIQALAKLPTRHELRGMLAGTLQAPMRNLAGTLNALLGNLRNALEARAGQLEAQ